MESPQIVGGELDTDPDTDADPNNLLERPQSYVVNQDALVAAIMTEMADQGATIDMINKAIPYLKTFASTLADVLVPAAGPAVAKVLGTLPNAI